MIVIGVDPGSRHLGWGIVRAEGTRIAHVAHGVIDADTEAPLVERLVTLHDGIEQVLATHAPEEAGVEAIFFARDASAAAKLGHARGVVLLALGRAKIPIGEYPPASVKRAVSASGRSDKLQVARMVCAILALRELPRPDAADALAVAITHVHSAFARRLAAHAPSPLEALLAPKRRRRATGGWR